MCYILHIHKTCMNTQKAWRHIHTCTVWVNGRSVYITWRHAVSVHFLCFRGNACDCTWCMCDFMKKNEEIVWLWGAIVRYESTTSCEDKRFYSNRNVSARWEGGYTVSQCSHFGHSVTLHYEGTRMPRDNGCSARPQLLLPVNWRVDSCCEWFWHGDSFNGK